jgi:hypothetical protein
MGMKINLTMLNRRLIDELTAISKYADLFER